MDLHIQPIGTVRGGRTRPEDDSWASESAVIELDGARFTPAALAGLDAFSHIEVVFFFHLAAAEKIETGARHPRGRTDWPKVGIFAQRGKDRPNRIGVSPCELLGTDGLLVRVRGLDAIDGTPVLDIKPYLSGFAPRGPVREPEWAREIMREYW